MAILRLFFVLVALVGVVFSSADAAERPSARGRNNDRNAVLQHDMEVMRKEIEWAQQEMHSYRSIRGNLPYRSSSDSNSHSQDEADTDDDEDDDDVDNKLRGKSGKSRINVETPHYHYWNKLVSLF